MSENQQSSVGDMQKFVTLAKEIVSGKSSSELANVQMEGSNMRFNEPGKFKQYQDFAQTQKTRLTETEFVVAWRLKEMLEGLNVDELFGEGWDLGKRQLMEHVLLQEGQNGLKEKAEAGKYLYDNAGKTGLWDTASPEVQGDALSAIQKMVHKIKPNSSLEKVENAVEGESRQLLEQGASGATYMQGINQALKKAGIIDEIVKIGKIWEIGAIGAQANQAASSNSQEPTREVEVTVTNKVQTHGFEKQIQEIKASNKDMTFNQSKKDQGSKPDIKGIRKAQAEADQKAQEEFNKKIETEYKKFQEQKRFQKKETKKEKKVSVFKKAAKMSMGAKAGWLNAGAVGWAGILAGIMQMFG